MCKQWENISSIFGKCHTNGLCFLRLFKDFLNFFFSCYLTKIFFHIIH